MPEGPAPGMPFAHRVLAALDTIDSDAPIASTCSTLSFGSTRSARAVVAAWLDAVADVRGVPRFWRFKHVDLGSRLVRLVDDAADQRGFRRIAVNTYNRPHLTRLEGGLDTTSSMCCRSGG